MTLKRWLLSTLSLPLLLAAGALVVVWATLPQPDGAAPLPGLSAEATVAFDGLGIPSVHAASRDDAMRVLGWLHARDRLFQMELIRRKSAGRLAELFGEKALAWDRKQRHYGFAQAAHAILANLPEAQQRTLAAYTEGVNAYISQAWLPPLEFLALGIRPEPWQAEDSLLAGLAMFQTLNSSEEDERAMTVMHQALPPALVEFLTPDQDEYDTVLLGGAQPRRPAHPVPVSDWSGLGKAERVAGAVDAVAWSVGSNQWVVGAGKTLDGRGIVANDMHLNLGVPNIWYRVAIAYGGHTLNGVTLPGVPALIVGSNGRVAWGFTNVESDVTDLVRLEINPANPNQYKIPGGWAEFVTRREQIQVKDGETVTEEIKETRWGPVSERPLLGRAVAVHWTALQADGVDLGMATIDEAETLTQAIASFNAAGGPTQNVALADDQGHIAWTLMGRYPLRQGFDGLLSQAGADGKAEWAGYIPPGQLPRLQDPPQGFIATANNRTLGSGYPFVIAQNQANGYRAYRIAQRLGEQGGLRERDLLAIQLDTRSEFFEFYRRLALELLNAEASLPPSLQESKQSIEAWDGRMDAGSLGIALLWAWRENLAAMVFAPVVARCRQSDADFHYRWRKLETPLRRLLSEKLPDTLPSPHYADWRSLLLASLTESAANLKQSQGVDSLADLTWGAVNRLPIRHPFSPAMPLLAPWLDMPEQTLSGCAGFCVRIAGNGHGASERMVISPAHPEDGILHMPGGQSGHPLSAHYRDQQPAWAEGMALPFLPGPSRHRLTLRPGG